MNMNIVIVNFLKNNWIGIILVALILLIFWFIFKLLNAYSSNQFFKLLALIAIVYIVRMVPHYSVAGVAVFIDDI